MSQGTTTPARRVYVPRTILIKKKTRKGQVAFEQKKVVDSEIRTYLWDNPELRALNQRLKDEERKKKEVEKAYRQDARFRRQQAQKKHS